MPEVAREHKRETIDVKRAAELLEVGTTSIHRWCDQGAIEFYKLSMGKTSPRRIYLDSVIAFAKKVQKRDITP